MSKTAFLALTVSVGLTVGPSAQQTPTFRSAVSLVTVDVSVLDNDGKPVPGLTAADFEITLNGHAQPVRVLTYETVDVKTPRVVSGVPSRQTTNAVPAHEPRLFVLLLDDLSIAPQRGKSLFFAASRFIASLLPSDYVGITTTSSTVTINPTLDHAAVQAGARRVAGEFIDPRDLPPDVAIGITEAMNYVAGDPSALTDAISRNCFGGQAFGRQQAVDDTCSADVEKKMRMLGNLSRQNTRRQIDAYVGVLSAMRPAPGLKQLVVISDGLGLASRDLIGDLEPLGHAAAAAGVQVSLLLEEPELTTVATSGRGAIEVKRDDDRSFVSNAQTVADITGGHFFRVIGSPDDAFARVAAASAAIYHLGVDEPPGAVRGRDFTVMARVTRGGVTVHANRTAIPAVAPVVVPVEDRMQAAIKKGQPYYAVPISLATVLRRGESEGQLDLDANVEIAAGTRGPLTVVFGLFDSAGSLRTGRKTVTAENGGNYRLSLSLPVRPGNYHLRFAVSDAAGNVGSIQSAVAAQLGRLGPFLTSDVLTSWNAPNGNPQFLALEEVPSTAVAVRAFLELYPQTTAPVPPDLHIRWILRDMDERAVAEHVVLAATAKNVLTANAEFALDTLPPGTYVIRAIVLAGNNVLGTVSTTIRRS